MFCLIEFIHCLSSNYDIQAVPGYPIVYKLEGKIIILMCKALLHNTELHYIYL